MVHIKKKWWKIWPYLCEAVRDAKGKSGGHGRKTLGLEIQIPRSSKDNRKCGKLWVYQDKTLGGGKARISVLGNRWLIGNQRASKGESEEVE